MADDGLVPIVLSTLRKAGWKATRLQAGTARGGRTHLAEAGWPDVIGLDPYGATYLIETKAKKGKLSKGQDAFMRWCWSTGHRYCVVSSVEDVARLVAW